MGNRNTIYPDQVGYLMEELEDKPKADWTAEDWAVYARHFSLEGNADKALRIADKAVRLGADESIYLWLADLFEDGRDADASYEAINRFVKALPDNEVGYQERAYMRLGREDKEGAREDIDTLLEKFPNWLGSHWLLVEWERLHGSHADWRKALEQARESERQERLNEEKSIRQAMRAEREAKPRRERRSPRRR